MLDRTIRTVLAVMLVSLVMYISPQTKAVAIPRGPIEVVTGTESIDPTVVQNLAQRGVFEGVLVTPTERHGQTSHAFSVFESIPIPTGFGQALDPGEVPYDIHRSSIIWIAKHYLTVEVPASVGSLSLSKKRAAAQLAIWVLSSNRTMEPSSQASGGVMVYRNVLLRNALQHATDATTPLQHVDFGKLILSNGESFFDGATVRFGVNISTDSKREELLPQQVVTIYDAKGEPYRYSMTNERGVATVQLPWREDGPLEADWNGSLQPGTFLSASGTTLILSQGVQFEQKKQIPHEAKFRDRAGFAWSVASRELNGYLGLMVAIVVGAAALFSAATFVKGLSALVKAFGITVVVVVVALALVVSYLLSLHGEHQRYHPPTTEQQPNSNNIQSAKIKRAEASSMYSSGTAPQCAVDGDISTGWQSGTGLGAGQVLSITFNKAAWINTIQIVPGRVTKWQDYQHSGFPANLQVFSDSDTFDQPETLTRSPDLGDDAASLRQARQSRNIDLVTPLHTKEVQIKVASTDPDKFSYVISEIRLGWKSKSDVSFVSNPQQPECQSP